MLKDLLQVIRYFGLLRLGTANLERRRAGILNEIQYERKNLSLAEFRTQIRTKRGARARDEDGVEPYMARLNGLYHELHELNIVLSMKRTKSPFYAS
jgi:hypothetical protein